MVDFLIMFENGDTKIARINLILITKSVHLQLFTLILNGVGVRCYRRRFSVLSPFIEKSMVYNINIRYMYRLNKTQTKCVTT